MSEPNDEFDAIGDAPARAAQFWEDEDGNRFAMPIDITPEITAFLGAVIAVLLTGIIVYAFCAWAV